MVASVKSFAELRSLERRRSGGTIGRIGGGTKEEKGGRKRGSERDRASRRRWGERQEEGGRSGGRLRGAGGEVDAFDVLKKQ